MASETLTVDASKIAPTSAATATTSPQPFLDDSTYDRDTSLSVPTDDTAEKKRQEAQKNLAFLAANFRFPELAARTGRAAMKNIHALMSYSVNPFHAKGLAFDPDRTAEALTASCTETTGRCLHNVADALSAGGLNIRAGLPSRDGSHWAKDASAALQGDKRFDVAAEGYGSDIKGNYCAQKGDVAVWEGGKYGHIMLCVGQRTDGSPIWKCDFTAREGNWTGLKDPASHGSFKIFRQHVLNVTPTMQVATAGPDRHIDIHKSPSPGLHAKT